MTEPKPQTAASPEPLAGTDANIHQRMLAVVAGIGYLPKTGTGPAEQGSYKFTRVEHVKDAIRDEHVRHGVMLHPTVDEATTEVITGSSGKHAFVARVQGRLTFVNVDKPDDRVEEVWAGMAVDYSDKAVSKAITAGIKAGLLNAYAIPTGDDPDTEAPTLPEGRAGDGRPRPVQQARPQRSYSDDGDPGPGGAGSAPEPGARCPKHDRPWKSGQYGWFCSAKDESEERGYCKQKPSKEWVASHER